VKQVEEKPKQKEKDGRVDMSAGRNNIYLLLAPAAAPALSNRRRK
jgi:hypothetical protein